jgi:transposase
MNKNAIEIFKIPPGLWVDRIENLEEQVIFHCRKTNKREVCPECETITSKIHQYSFRKIKHGILNENLLIIKLKVRRFKCQKCGKVFTEKFKGVNRKQTTTCFREQAIKWLQRNSFNYIGEKFKISPGTLARYLTEMCDFKKINWLSDEITKLGIDEHSFRGRNLLITITDLSNRKLLAVLEDDNQITLEQFLESVPTLAKKRIKEVCIDISSSYRRAIEKYLPKAKITIDRFHAEQLANRMVDEVRGAVVASEPRRMNIKNLLLKAKEKLTEKEQEKLKLVFARYENYPVLYESWFIKEKVREMFRSENKKEARRKFNQVLNLLLDAHRSRYLKTFRKTLLLWQENILNYFDNRTTNAFTEGCHTKIKMIKRVSFGFKNITNYINKVTLAFLPLLWITHYHTI